jgi:hypothetical protein
VFEYCSGDTKQIVSRYTRVRLSPLSQLFLALTHLCRQFAGERDFKGPRDFDGSAPGDGADEEDGEVDGDDAPVPLEPETERSVAASNVQVDDGFLATRSKGQVRTFSSGDDASSRGYAAIDQCSTHSALGGDGTEYGYWFPCRP